MRKIINCHPIVFAVYPALFLFSLNQEELAIYEIATPIIYTTLLAVVLWLLLFRILKDIQKSGLIVSFLLFMTFSYGHFYSSIPEMIQSLNFHLIGIRIGPFKAILVLYLILTFIWLYFILRTQINHQKLVQLVAGIAFLLVIVPIIKVSYYQLTKYLVLTRIARGVAIDLTSSSSGSSKVLRDIYYIILDRYPNDQTLKDVYDYDNSEFSNFLTSKGFFVARNSFANYLKTGHSLASSLNMEYINYLSASMRRKPKDWSPIYRLIKNNNVLRLVKRKGYKSILFGSSWQPTRNNKNYDININYTRMLLNNEFQEMYLSTTIFSPILGKLIKYDKRVMQWERVLYKLEKLSNIPDMDEPTFVFAHFLLPHPPFIFDREGNFIHQSITNSNPDVQKVHQRWLDQVIFTNKALTDLINKLLSKSAVAPIIILQGDEGPFPYRYIIDEFHFNWKSQATLEELSQKFGILNAYYLPNIGDKNLYDSISPVNSFRIIFNKYFGFSFDLLPDKVYIFEDGNHIYKFYDITDKLVNYHP